VVYEGTDGNTANDKILVAEAAGANMRVQRFDAEGRFERMWGKDVDGSAPFTGYEICSVRRSCQAPALGSTGAAAGEFDDPTGLAVDQQNGWLYVYDRDNHRIQKFDLDGNFLLMFGDNVNATDGTDVCAAADLTAGDTCSAGVGGASIGQIGPVGSSTLQVRGLAVDPVTSDVFVADPTNRRLQRFNADGTLDASPVLGSAGTGAGQFATNQPLHLAVDASGIVYASDANPSTSAQRINRFDSATGAAVAAIASPPLLPGGGVTPTLGLEIDSDSDGGGPDQEHLLVVRDPASAIPPATVPDTGNNTVVQEFDIPAVPTDPILAPQLVDTHVFAAQAVNGIGVSSGGGDIYLPAAFSSSQFPACSCGSAAGIVILAASTQAPTAEASPPTTIGSDSAELAGTVNPGGPGATYRFEVSKSGIDFDSVGDPEVIGGLDDVSVSRTASDLDANALYRAKLIVTRITSLTTVATATSSEITFVTDPRGPDAITDPPAYVGTTAAGLAGRVNPHGLPTTHSFRYGLSLPLISQTPTRSSGAGWGYASASHDLATESGFDYRYQITASNDQGSVNGGIVGFRTPDTAPPPFGRGYELVSPADKLSGVGAGRYAQGDVPGAYPGIASADGDRYIVHGALGAMLLDSAQAYANDFAFAERTATGWRSHSPFTHPSGGSSNNRFANIRATSTDLSTLLWGSNGGSFQVFDDELGLTAGVPKLSDWQGRWEIFGPKTVAESNGDLDGGGSARVVSADGSHAALSSAFRGLAGVGDPFLDVPTSASAAYLSRLANPLPDTFAGGSDVEPLGLCDSGTEIPERVASGKLDVGGQGCPTPLTSKRGSSLGSPNPSDDVATRKNLLSADGSRAFFLSPDPATQLSGPTPTGGGQATCASEYFDSEFNTVVANGPDTECPAQMYVRYEDDDGSVATRWISRTEVTVANGAAAEQDASLLGRTIYEGATPDGDKVFFRTTSPLTADDPNGAGSAPAGGVTTGVANSNSWDLYMYDFPDGQGSDPGDGQLTRISAGPTGASDPQVSGPTGTEGAPGMAASLRLVSTDGRRVFFVTSAPLAGVPAAANGTTTTQGGGVLSNDGRNLYLFDAAKPAADRWRFVVRIPNAVTSNTDLDGCATTGTRSGYSSLVPNAADDGTVVANNVPHNCVTGADDGSFISFFTRWPLIGNESSSLSGDIYGYDADADTLTRISTPRVDATTYRCAETANLGFGVDCFGDTGIGPASSLDESHRRGVATDPARPGDRIVYFQSKSALVAADVDAHYDVYEWRNGDLSLISPGTPSPAYYAGNSADGQDVFIMTRDRLSWQDRDEVMDVYDAREGGGFAEPPPPPVGCVLLAQDCQDGGGTSPIAISPETGTTGNDNAQPGPRQMLTVAVPSGGALKRAGRTGKLAVRVRGVKAGPVGVTARARIGNRMRQIGRKSGRLSGPKTTTLNLRLSSAAMKVLKTKRRLNVSLKVSAKGARTRSISFVLRRAAR
jgi:hypothetical protein